MRPGQASVTAQRVAAHRLTFDRLPAPYGDPGADDALATDVAAAASAAPGPMREYLRARTRFFDGVVTRALGRGCTQVVTGAAGYDGRSLRYAKPGVLWFEVDHPATQNDKRARLDRLGSAAVTSGSSRPTSPRIPWRTGCARPTWTRTCRACSSSKASPAQARNGSRAACRRGWRAGGGRGAGGLEGRRGRRGPAGVGGPAGLGGPAGAPRAARGGSQG